MENPNPIYYKDLIAPDSSISDLIGQLKDLIKEYGVLKDNVQASASEMAKGMQNISGATEEQRKNITVAAQESEKLVSEYTKINTEEQRLQRMQIELNAAFKEQTQIEKLIVQINTSAEGSYNKLSAQYRLNKIRLNEMSLAERQGTDAGRQLEAETNALYEEMKRLQEATGKHQLNVGNYAEAAQGLRQELMSLTRQMAYMKINGEQNSEEYTRMAARAAELKDAMNDANSEVQAMASDTQQLDATMGATSAASGGMAAVTGSMALMGQTSETATDAQKNLGAAVGIVSGLTAVQNALQKESNLMTGIRIIQTKAAAKAEALDTATKKKNIAATAGATIAQKSFNLVASMNPYVLLAIALVSVVGALVAFTAGANRATKAQDKLNKALAAQLEYMDSVAKETTRINNERIEEYQREIEIIKARNGSIEEVRKLEDEIYKERVAAHDKQMQIYSEQIEGIEANRLKVQELQKTLLALREAQAAGKNRLKIDIDLDGEVDNVKIDKAIDVVQAQVDNYGKQVEIGVGLKEEGAEIAKQRAVQLAQRRQEAIQAAKTETDIIRSSQDARLAIIRDSYTREKKTLQLNAQRQIEDIQTRLKTEGNITKKAREALQKQERAIRVKYAQDLNALNNKYNALNVQAIRDTQDLELELMEEGAEKQRKALQLSYERQIEDFNNLLATDSDLTERQVDEISKQLLLLADKYKKDLEKLNEDIATDVLQKQEGAIQLGLEATMEGTRQELELRLKLIETQRQIELAENRKLAEDLRQDEAAINAKYNKQALETTAKYYMDLQNEELDYMQTNGRQKTALAIQLEIERLQTILKLNETALQKMSDEDVEQIQKTISRLEKIKKSLPYSNLYEVLGIALDDKQQDALNEVLNSINESIGSIIDSWNQAAEAAVDAADKQVESAQKVLDAQIEAQNQGYAANVKQAQKDLALAQKSQEKAKKEKEKAAAVQMALDSVTQASSLVTASANLWSAFSSIPYVGPALAVAAIATMWGSFLASKIYAAQVTKQTEQYGEGTVELLEGGSHASGHDIDLGTKKDGTRRRAEGGEFFAVINKRSSRRYRKTIPDVINSLNDGTFSDKYQSASEQMSGYAIAMLGGTDVTKLEKDVSAIRQQGDEARYYDGNTIIIRHKNLTRKIVS